MKRFFSGLLGAILFAFPAFADVTDDSVTQTATGTLTTVVYVFIDPSLGSKAQLGWLGGNGSGSRYTFLEDIAGDGLLFQTSTDKPLIFAQNGQEVVRITTDQHLKVSSSYTPSVSSQASAGDCGTSPSVAGTDIAGKITVGSSTNQGQCRLTFGATVASGVSCFAQNITSGRCVTGKAPTTSKVDFSGRFDAGDEIQYFCVER